MTEGDALRLLGLGRGASRDEVRAAFRSQVMKRHPDTASDEAGGPDVQALVDAYRLLLGSEARTESGSTPRSGERSGSGRRIEVEHRPEPNTRRSTGGTRPCQGCGGSGFRTRVARCPACRGSGQVTVLDIDRARMSPCRSCRGRGSVRTVEICGVCGGAVN